MTQKRTEKKIKSLRITPPTYLRAYVSSCFHRVRLFATLWTVAQGSSVHGILQPWILEWIAISSSRESSQSRDQTHVFYVSCTGRQILYHSCHLGDPPPTYVSVFICTVIKVCLICEHSVLGYSESPWYHLPDFTSASCSILIHMLSQ